MQCSATSVKWEIDNELSGKCFDHQRVSDFPRLADGVDKAGSLHTCEKGKSRSQPDITTFVSVNNDACRILICEVTVFHNLSSF